MQAEIFFNAECTLGEGPFWYQDRFWWVDIDRSELRTINLDAGDARSVNVGRKLGVAVPHVDGRFVLGLQDGFGLLDWATGVVTPVHDPEAHLPENRFNDGKADPQGRFIAGTMGKGGAGALYKLDLDGSVHTLLSGVSTSNGLAWSSDGLRFFYIDTPTEQVRVFDYDPDRGTISNARLVCEFDGKNGHPDGMTIDADDHLWVAFWDGGAVRCYDSINGRQLEEIIVPGATRTTSCCFGGPELDQLFITSAGSPYDEPTEGHENAGRLFVCKPGVKGCEIDLCKVELT